MCVLHVCVACVGKEGKEKKKRRRKCRVFDAGELTSPLTSSFLRYVISFGGRLLFSSISFHPFLAREITHVK